MAYNICGPPDTRFARLKRWEIAARASPRYFSAAAGTGPITSTSYCVCSNPVQCLVSILIPPGKHLNALYKLLITNIMNRR
ncbi:hypothetical protein PUN28_017338 [Cardiocondyla obscurior]|uniref:Uncharacterized protein n=1 Tax=Cardiocondyla obscurior TaxID=286306 RepID=A0AAW2ELE0_9HYME